MSKFFCLILFTPSQSTRFVYTDHPKVYTPSEPNLTKKSII